MGNKYRNHSFTNKYGHWDSKKEFQRYLFLLNRVARKEITGLYRQVKFVLVPAQYEECVIKLKTKEKIKSVCVEKEISYYADFTYTENGKYIVEDVKSEITRKNPEYIIKRKLMRYIHHIAIKEV